MEKEENLKDILKQIQGVENGINSMIVPMLKDTINDYKRTFNKMVIIIVILILGLLGVISYSQYLIADQNKQYKEFLEQFEFTSDETIYQETTDNSVISDGITVNK